MRRVRKDSSRCREGTWRRARRRGRARRATLGSAGPDAVLVLRGTHRPRGREVWEEELGVAVGMLEQAPDAAGGLLRWDGRVRLVQGQRLRGRAGAAGKTGQVSVNLRARWCRRRGPGCPGAYAPLRSAQAVSSPVLGSELEARSGPELVRAGGCAVLYLASDLGYLVGAGVGSAVDLFNPELAFVGGELVPAGDAIRLLPVEHSIERQPPRLAASTPDFLPGSMHPGSVAMSGKALVLRQDHRPAPPPRTRATFDRKMRVNAWHRHADAT